MTHPDDEHRLLLLYDDPLYPELLVPVTDWGVPAAAELARRSPMLPGGKHPYAFRLLTVRRVGHVGASAVKMVRASPTYFLGGTAWTYAELATGPDSPEVREVLARMRSRNYERVIWTSSGTTQPFLAGDEIV